MEITSQIFSEIQRERRTGMPLFDPTLYAATPLVQQLKLWSAASVKVWRDKLLPALVMEWAWIQITSLVREKKETFKSEEDLNFFHFLFSEFNPKLGEVTHPTRVAYVKFMAKKIKRDVKFADENEAAASLENEKRTDSTRSSSRSLERIVRGSMVSLITAFHLIKNLLEIVVGLISLKDTWELFVVKSHELAFWLLLQLSFPPLRITKFLAV